MEYSAVPGMPWIDVRRDRKGRVAFVVDFEGVGSCAWDGYMHWFT